jgi:hypothetical protein
MRSQVQALVGKPGSRRRTARKSASRRSAGSLCACAQVRKLERRRSARGVGLRPNWGALMVRPFLQRQQDAASSASSPPRCEPPRGCPRRAYSQPRLTQGADPGAGLTGLPDLFLDASAARSAPARGERERAGLAAGSDFSRRPRSELQAAVTLDHSVYRIETAEPSARQALTPRWTRLDPLSRTVFISTLQLPF